LRFPAALLHLVYATKLRLYPLTSHGFTARAYAGLVYTLPLPHLPHPTAPTAPTPPPARWFTLNLRLLVAPACLLPCLLLCLCVPTGPHICYPLPTYHPTTTGFGVPVAGCYHTTTFHHTWFWFPFSSLYPGTFIPVLLPSPVVDGSCELQRIYPQFVFDQLQAHPIYYLPRFYGIVRRIFTATPVPHRTAPRYGLRTFVHVTPTYAIYDLLIPHIPAITTLYLHIYIYHGYLPQPCGYYLRCLLPAAHTLPTAALLPAALHNACPARLAFERCAPCCLPHGSAARLLHCHLRSLRVGLQAFWRRLFTLVPAPTFLPAALPLPTTATPG